MQFHQVPCHSLPPSQTNKQNQICPKRLLDGISDRKRHHNKTMEYNQKDRLFRMVDDLCIEIIWDRPHEPNRERNDVLRI